MKPGDLDLADPTLQVRFGGPPHDYFKMLRREAPVHFNELSEAGRSEDPIPMNKGFWVLTKHADIVAASKDSSLFSSHRGGPILWDPEEEALASQRAGMMGMDRPDHTRYRKLVSGGFTPRGVTALEPVIREAAQETIDAIAGKGRCDFVMDLAWNLPLTVMCEFMGIPHADRDLIFKLSTEAATPEGRPQEMFRASLFQLMAYGVTRAQAKRESPDDTLLSKYANADFGGEPMTDAEIGMFFVTLSIAGHETTRNTSNHLIRLLSENPDQKELLLSDLDRYLPNAIEEALRHSPPVMQFRRTLTADHEMRGQKMGEGDKIYLSYCSANRDEEVFADPDRFDITRENAKDHLAFGSGTHFCMGAQLARTQLRILFTEILTRLPDIRVVGSPEYLASLWFNAIQHMDVEYTPS